MFGFLRGNRKQKVYRQVYAECCDFQRREFGWDSLAFLSYEAIFLYVLAIESGACERPPSAAVSCCRLRHRANNWPSFDRELAHFCSCFAMLLASIKLDDDVRDNGSLFARFLRRRFSTRFENARRYFSSIDTVAETRIAESISAHLALECRSSGRITIEDYVRPTADAFRYFFELCSRRLGPAANAHRFGKIGEHVGAAIVAADCAIDFERDRRRGDFNPLRASERDEALDYARSELAGGGWMCVDSFGSDSIGARVLKSNFDRLRLRDPVEPRRIPRFRPTQVLRRGECDCFCDPSCCEACSSGPCEGDAVTGILDCCICTPADGCWWSREPRRKQEKPEPHSRLVGGTGRTVRPLRPSGVVVVGKVRLPARSTREWIGADTQIEVVAEEPFGVVVRPTG